MFVISISIISYSISINSSKRSVLVIGATGKTGYQIVQKLLSISANSNNDDDSQELVITAACRDLSKGRLLFGPDSNKIKCIPFDISKDSNSRYNQLFNNIDAVIIASGAIGIKESYNIDNIGNKKLIDAAINNNVNKLVLITSLLTSGLESGQLLNPQFILLNLFGGLLLNKRQAEV